MPEISIEDQLLQDLTGEEFARTLNEHNRRLQTAVEERNRQQLESWQQQEDWNRSRMRGLGGFAGRVDYLRPNLWGGGQAPPQPRPNNDLLQDMISHMLGSNSRTMADAWAGSDQALTSTPSAPDPDITLTHSSTGPVPSPNLPSPAYRERLRRVGARALLAQIDQSAAVERFQQWVIERGLRFYTRSNVEAYLLQKAKAYLTKDGGKSAQSYGLSWRLAVEWTPLPKYTHPIPDPVLETIEGVAGEFAQAQFFISEVKEYPDPFLMVRLGDGKEEWIIEKWDAPDYRES
jgi:hypothetical protein